jgi:hypothetical protein
MAETNYLQRDDSVETFLPRSINDRLAAASNLFEQLVITKDEGGVQLDFDD